MQDKTNINPIESDVNRLIKQDLFCFDSDISTAFKELKIENILKRSKIIKRCGHPVSQIVFDLCVIPFLMFNNIFIFAKNQFDEAKASKSTFYRFLSNSKYNWSYFIFWLSVDVFAKIKPVSGSVNYFVLDDTIKEVTGKGVEGASYLYDHSQGKTVLGFQKLVLGCFNGTHFVPIIQKFCSGKKKAKSKSKATKYKKNQKSEQILPNSPGAKERKDLEKTKLEKGFSMLRRAKRQFKHVELVLFDSWFCFNSYIIKIKKKLNLNVICQLKNLPRPNKYIYKNKSYSLAQLFSYHAKPRMRAVKNTGHKQAVLTVKLSGSDVRMKVVFILNDDQQKWHAFGSTDIKMSAKAILEHYSQRWSIEVFFKNCKQYLNYGKEQVSDFDSLVCSDAISFMRYMILTYISYKENTELYAAIERSRNQRKFIEYGFRLLQFFMKRIVVIVEVVINLLDSDNKEKAILVLKNFIRNANNMDKLMQSL